MEVVCNKDMYKKNVVWDYNKIQKYGMINSTIIQSEHFQFLITLKP